MEKDNGVVQSDTRVIWCGSKICEQRAVDGTTVIGPGGNPCYTAAQGAVFSVA